MQEIAALPIKAPPFLKVRKAELGLVLAIGGLIFLEFICAVSKLAFSIVPAESKL